ncbi:MAG: 30S ribosomal protein S4 [Halobacteriovoraceae bacterium]|nr:30S ribosomal protein S4 [Halobacteriovoraceae bacterium]
MSKATTGKGRFKVQRALGLELPGLGKPGALERRPYAPGVHGNKRKKISDYAVRQREKQKLTHHYGLREKQLVNYIKKAKKDTSRAWIDTLIITLESRLSNVIFRLNFAPSILAACQMISHGQVLLNGKKVKSAGIIIKRGDVISLTEKGYKGQSYSHAQSTPRLPAVPACFDMEGKDLKKATVAQEPLATDIPFEFEEQLVTEHYWKI